MAHNQPKKVKKNSTLHYEFREKLPYLPKLKKFIPLNIGNYGLIFTKLDAYEVMNIIGEFIVETPIKVGMEAPHDIILPYGPTGLDTGKIDLFHKLNIPVKIIRGQLEIAKTNLSPESLVLVKRGEKVKPNECLVCRTLNYSFKRSMFLKGAFNTKTGIFLNI